MAAAATEQQEKIRYGELEAEDGGDRSPPIAGHLARREWPQKVTEEDEGSEVTAITNCACKLARMRLSKSAIELRALSKFGDSMKKDASTMGSISGILLERSRAPGNKCGEPTASADPLAMESKVDPMICRTCGKKGHHLTSKCTFKDLAPHAESSIDKSPCANGPAASPNCSICMRAVDRNGTDFLRRRAEAMRRRAAAMRRRAEIIRRASCGADVIRLRNDETSVRLTNLPENTSQRDVYNLAGPCGVVIHVELALDEETGSCRKFAIVEFVQRKDAEVAVSFLSGYTYGNLKLKAEWITPEPKDHAPLVCPICMRAAETSIRVTNLPENTSQRDLRNLAAPFGVVTGLYLAVDEKAGSGRQFGIVKFVQRKDAETAISWLNGYVYGKLNLQAEQATLAEVAFVVTK